jgi:serine phosphatase RsbU (regulator of sigma subunit)
MPLRNRLPDISFLFEASRRLNRALELERLLTEIRTICLEAVDAEAVNVLIWDDEKSRLEFQVAFNRTDEAARRLYLRPNEGLAGWIAANDQPVIVNDIHQDLRYKVEVDRIMGFDGRSVLGVPIHRGRGVVGVVELLNRRSPDGFTERDLLTMTALADPIAVALENALLYRDLEREKAGNDIVYRIGSKLSQSIELGETLELILDLIGEVLPYDAAGISLVRGEPPAIELVSVRGYPPGTEETFRLKVGEGAVGWVVKTGEALRIPDVSRDRRYVAVRPSTRSELTVPLVNEAKVIGAFNLENDTLDAYRTRDVRLLMSLANQAAISVGRVRLYRQVLSRQRLQDEVDLARRIQQSFLPAADPELPGFQISGSTVPSSEVGGDSFDFIRINSEQLGIMVADVAGKGMGAALILAAFRAAMRTEVRNEYAIRRILFNVNRLLCESTHPEQFVTAVYGVLDLERRMFTYSNAGHNPPLLLRANGEAVWLSEGGLILGSFQEAVHHEEQLRLAPGDHLVLYTDGASECMNAAGEEYGTGRLLEAVRLHRSRSAREIRLALQEGILQHCEGRAQDDVTLVVLKVL